MGTERKLTPRPLPQDGLLDLEIFGSSHATVALLSELVLRLHSVL